MSFRCRVTVMGDLFIGEEDINLTDIMTDRHFDRPGRAEVAEVFPNIFGIETRWDGRPAELWSPRWDFEHKTVKPDVWHEEAI